LSADEQARRTLWLWRSAAGFHRRTGAPRHQQATGGEGQRVRVQAGDALPLPIQHTNLIFSALFAASLVYLMRRWQEKIRASTPLHVVSLAKIFAPPLYYTSRRILGPDAINLKGKCALGPFLSILVIECQHEWTHVDRWIKCKSSKKVCF
jgi:hypothetical protein